MSDLTNPFEAIVQQASGLPESGALRPYTERLQASLEGSSIILIDVSGSMAEYVESGERKIDILRQAIASTFTWRSSDRPIAIAFASSVSEISNALQIPDPVGGTDLAGAIAYCFPFKPGNTLIVSDGMPNCKESALAAAQKLSGIINTLFIGRDSDTDSREFMRLLAQIGCGRSQYCNISVSPLTLLQSSIQALLPSS